VRICIFWIELQSLVVIRKRTFAIVLLPIGLATEVISRGIFGANPDRHVEIVEGRIMLTPALVSLTSVEVCSDIFRVETDSFSEIRDRKPDLAFLFVHIAACV